MKSKAEQRKSDRKKNDEKKRLEKENKEARNNLYHVAVIKTHYMLNSQMSFAVDPKNKDMVIFDPQKGFSILNDSGETGLQTKTVIRNLRFLTIGNNSEIICIDGARNEVIIIPENGEENSFRLPECASHCLALNSDKLLIVSLEYRASFCNAVSCMNIFSMKGEFLRKFIPHYFGDYSVGQIFDVVIDRKNDDSVIILHKFIGYHISKFDKTGLFLLDYKLPEPCDFVYREITIVQDVLIVKYENMKFHMFDLNSGAYLRDFHSVYRVNEIASDGEHLYTVGFPRYDIQIFKIERKKWEKQNSLAFGFHFNKKVSFLVDLWFESKKKKMLTSYFALLPFEVMENIFFYLSLPYSL